MSLNIVFLDRDTIIADFSRPEFDHTWLEYQQTAADEILPRLAEADIVILNKVVLNAEILQALPRLKLIAISATGCDNVDLDACSRLGKVVCNVRAYAETSVPEHALMMMLALRRQLVAYRQDVAAGRWQTSPGFCFFDHPIKDLAGATLTIVGVGSLGNGVARLAAAFGMTVLDAERKGAEEIRPGYVPFYEALGRADVVSLHCPLNAQTRNLIGAPELDAMRPGAILINTARGGLVDEAVLADYLRAGRIAAGFDVLSQEPPRDGNPLLAPDVLKLPNFILTPHVAWASGAAMQEVANQVITNVEAWYRGETKNSLV